MNNYTVLFSKYSNKFHSIISKSLLKEDYETALQGINGLTRVCYEWNQFYVDKEIEESILKIAEVFKNKKYNSQTNDNIQSILFYDSFGLDHRGLAAIYLKGLARLGLRIIYVTDKSAEGKQPLIRQILDGVDYEVRYVDRNNSYMSVIDAICCIFHEFAPNIAFEYNSPWDVEGFVAFSSFINVKRYKINLTDHTFWAGVNSFDYCIEFRDYGANISEQFRGVDHDRLIKLPFYPYINKSVAFQGFDFDTKGKKVIFSGGALYKTHGEGNIYYHIVEEILKYDDNSIFVYAGKGKGDSSKLEELSSKFSGRVFHIDERKDLLGVLENSYLYLSTYPIIGGLMSQYAAVAGKLPITLKRKSDNKDVLIDEERIGNLFFDSEELIEDVKRLLDDPKYKESKEQKLKNSVITELEFEHELENVVINNKTKYNINSMSIDTTDFLKSYVNRFGFNELVSFTLKRNIKLVKYFPKAFYIKALSKLKRK